MFTSAPVQTVYKYMFTFFQRASVGFTKSTSILEFLLMFHLLIFYLCFPMLSICSYMVGCQGYPRCRASIFFPKFVLEALVDESLCQQCQPGDVHQIRFKFKRGSVPPMMPLE